MRGRCCVRRQRTCRPFGRVHQHFQRASLAIQADHVALADLGQRTTACRFRRHVDRRRNLARGTGQATVGDQRHAPALVLQQAQQRRQRMQFGHAVGTRALVTHHRHEVLRQQATGVQLVQHLRCIDHHGRRFDRAVLRLYRRQLDQRLAEVAAQQAQAALVLERIVDATHHLIIGAAFQARQVDQLAIAQLRFACVVGHAAARHADQIAVHQAGLDQLAEHERRAASGREAVDVGLAVRIDAGQQRNQLRQFVEIVPSQHDTGGARHCDPVDGVVGRTAGGHQRDDRVDDRALVDDPAQRTEVVAERSDVQCTFGRFAGQRIAQRRARIDERCARQLHAHRFQQHLVGIGGAVEGAGAGAVV